VLQENRIEEGKKIFEALKKAKVDVEAKK